MANKPTEEQRQLLRQLEELIGNPMNALDVYAPFKRFEEYFILTVFGNLNVRIQRSYGKTITDEIMKCRVLLPKCQFGTRTSKLAATVDFLNAFATILGCVEFIILRRGRVHQSRSRTSNANQGNPFADGWFPKVSRKQS